MRMIPLRENKNLMMQTTEYCQKSSCGYHFQSVTKTFSPVIDLIIYSLHFSYYEKVIFAYDYRMSYFHRFNRYLHKNQ